MYPHKQHLSHLPPRSLQTLQGVMEELQASSNYQLLWQLRGRVQRVLNIRSDERYSVQQRRQAYDTLHSSVCQAVALKTCQVRALSISERDQPEVIAEHVRIRNALRQLLRRMPGWIGPGVGILDARVVNAAEMILEAIDERIDQIRPEGDPQAAWNKYVRSRETG